MKRKTTQRRILFFVLLATFGFDSVLAQDSCTGASISDWSSPSQVVRYEVAGAKPLAPSYAASEKSWAYFSDGDSVEISPDGNIKISLLGMTVPAAFLKIGTTAPTFRFSVPRRSGSYTLRIGTIDCAADSSVPKSASGVSLEVATLSGEQSVLQTDLHLTRVTE